MAPARVYHLRHPQPACVPVGERARRDRQAQMAQSTSEGPRALPTGTVTFLFTDIEGSTKLVQALGDRYDAVLADHCRIIRDAIAQGGGTEVNTEGDSFFAVFPSPVGAVEASTSAQRGLAAHA